MIRSIFIILVTCIIITIGCFFVKGHYGFDALENFNIDKITGTLTQDTFLKDKTPKKGKLEETTITPKPKEAETSVYFLKTNGESAKLESTKKEFNTDSDKFRAAMEALFSGPSKLEKIAGVYSEIPANTKLLGIKEDKNSYTINISDDFEIGGGADSMRTRVKQLVTTATRAANGKDVYLEINGKKVEYIGGEGIIILQPLHRNL